jgi:hypothetical protein
MNEHIINIQVGPESKGTLSRSKRPNEFRKRSSQNVAHPIFSHINTVCSPKDFGCFFNFKKWPEESDRPTGENCEKIAQNVAQPVCVRTDASLFLWKQYIAQKNLGN